MDNSTKKTLILVLLCFILGLSFFFYPLIADQLYQKNKLITKEEYVQTVKDISEKEINERLRKCYEYNEKLYKSGIVLAEPFEPELFDIDEEYLNLLSEKEEMGYVIIPSLNIDLPIYHTTAEEVLQKGVGHLLHTSLPVGGENTKAVISAHNGLPGAEMFTNIDKLQNGNLVQIEIYDRVLSYKVYDTKKVEPKDISDLYVEEGKDILVLVTCTPYGVNSHRLLVFCERIPNPVIKEVEHAEPKLKQEINVQDILNYIFFFLLVVFVALSFSTLIRKVIKDEKN